MVKFESAEGARLEKRKDRPPSSGRGAKIDLIRIKSRDEMLQCLLNPLVKKSCVARIKIQLLTGSRISKNDTSCVTSRVGATPEIRQNYAGGRKASTHFMHGQILVAFVTLGALN